MTTTETHSLTGWDIARAADVAWTPWGDQGNARAKLLSSADGAFVVLVEAEAGYSGTYHEHTSTEFLYVLEGRLRNQGRAMEAGDAFAAAAGSVHSDFEAEVTSRYLTIFRL
jgi:quercetin dioxygenase-like cupin family protein